MNVSIKARAAVIIIVLTLIIAGLLFWFLKNPFPSGVLKLYGHVDIRQVQVAFYNQGRIQKMYVQEGDRVREGQLLAELNPSRFQDAVTKFQQQVAAQEATVKNAELIYERYRVLVKRNAVTQQDLDNATANLRVARHTLQAEKAALALALRELVDSKLYAPQNGIIQTRILEKGDMVTPQSPVFTLAISNPVWVRAYLPEVNLGQVQLGMKAWILSDSFPDRRFPAWVGYISPTSEFTPKNVETTELRTQLVYQVRIYACNPKDELRLGMPVTVHIPMQDNQPQSLGAQVCGQ